MRKSQKKYIEHRKSLVKEERNLIFQRDKLNKKLREIRESLYNWDNWLVSE